MDSEELKEFFKTKKRKLFISIEKWNAILEHNPQCVIDEITEDHDIFIVPEEGYYHGDAE